MIQQIMIPLAAFAITATGVSAFNSDILNKLNLDLSTEQVSALEEAHELRMDGAERDEVHAVLEDAGIDFDTMKDVREATHEYRETMREKVHEALENNDYEAFLEAVQGSPLEDIIDTENEFDQFMEAFDLRQAGDYEGAREIMDELGIERPGGFGHGHGLRDGNGLGQRDQFGGNGNGMGRGGGNGFGGRGN